MLYRPFIQAIQCSADKYDGLVNLIEIHYQKTDMAGSMNIE